MADGDVLKARSLDGLSDFSDVLDENVRVAAGVLASLDTSGGDTVKILTADGDTGNEVVDLTTVLVDGALQSSKLVVEGILASGGPETEEKTGLGLDGSRNSRDGFIGSTSLL